MKKNSWSGGLRENSPPVLLNKIPEIVVWKIRKQTQENVG